MKILVLSDEVSPGNPLLTQLDQMDDAYVVTPAVWPTYATSVLEEIDLILLNVYHGVDRDELIRLRRETRLPILLLAPIEDEKMLVQLYGSGVDDHLVTPVSQALLNAKLRVWQRWVTRLSSVLYH